MWDTEENAFQDEHVIDRVFSLSSSNVYFVFAESSHDSKLFTLQLPLYSSLQLLPSRVIYPSLPSLGDKPEPSASIILQEKVHPVVRII